MKAIKKEVSYDQTSKIFFQEMLAGDAMVLPAGSFRAERTMPSGALHACCKPASDPHLIQRFASWRRMILHLAIVWPPCCKRERKKPLRMTRLRNYLRCFLAKLIQFQQNFEAVRDKWILLKLLLPCLFEVCFVS